MSNTYKLTVNIPEEELSKLKSPTLPLYDNVEIRLGEISTVCNLHNELKIDNKNLLNTMLEHSSRYGWWASIHVYTKNILRKLEREDEKTRRILDISARQSLQEHGIKITEEAVKSWISNDPRSDKYFEDLNNLKEIRDFTDTVLRAFEHRRDMIKEINREACSDKYLEK